MTAIVRMRINSCGVIRKISNLIGGDEMKHFLSVFLFFNVISVNANAQDLTGWCVDMGEPGCLDRYVPFYGNSIGWCESGCELSNPVSVTNMKATLYDYTCRSDHAGIERSRAMILTQQGWDGLSKHSFITNKQTLPITRCP